MLYPDVFTTAETTRLYAEIQASLKKVLTEISEGGNAGDEIMEKTLLKQTKPLNFLGNNSVEIQYERNYEELCIKLSTFTNRDPKRINLKEFYALLSYAKKNNKSNSTNRNHSNNGY